MKNRASRETSQAVQPPGTVRVRVVLRPGAVRLGNWTDGQEVDVTPDEARVLVAVKGCQYVGEPLHAVAPADADAAAAAAGEGGGASFTPSAE
jgi:hypothetical protein